MNQPGLVVLAAQFVPRFIQIHRGTWLALVAELMAWGGTRMEAALHRYSDRLGWATVALLTLGLLAFR